MIKFFEYYKHKKYKKYLSEKYFFEINGAKYLKIKKFNYTNSN